MASRVWLLLAVNCIITTQYVYGLMDYAKTCNVTSYGAKGDGKTDNTKYIQSAIDDCSNASSSNNGQSLVVLPKLSGAKTVYMSGAIWLKSNIDFYIEEDVKLLGMPCTNLSANNMSYPWTYKRYGGVMQMQPSSLLNGAICSSINYNANIIGDQCKKWNKLENIKIFGYGTIDGNGHSGWYIEPFKAQSPCLIDLLWINNLKIYNVTVTDSPNWTVHPTFCSNIIIDNVTILTDGPNTDGLNPDSCQNVVIQNCYISTGDDCIAIKSGKDADGRAVNISSNNITIRNVQFGNGHGITIGSEMSGNVTNILFDNCTADGTQKGPNIKSTIGRGGIVENVTYSNIKLKNVQNGIAISETYNGANQSGPVPIIKNIYYINITGTVTKAAGIFDCLQQTPCTQIDMDHVHISGESQGFSCQNVHGHSTDVTPKSCID